LSRIVPKGKKPPITPRRSLVKSDEPKRKLPPAPFRQAMAKMREKQRMKQQGEAKIRGAGLGGEGRGTTLPVDPRAAAKSALTGAAAGSEKAWRKIERAKQKLRDDMRGVGFTGDDVGAFMKAANDITPATTEAPTNRPPRRDSGRYDGLKDG
jgi:hypothetical protein